MSKTIGVIFGGPSPEHDISILTGLQSVRILSKKYEVTALYWSKDNKWYSVNNEYESVDFLNNKKIYKNKLEMKFNEDPGFYQKRKKLDFSYMRYLNSKFTKITELTHIDSSSKPLIVL